MTIIKKSLLSFSCHIKKAGKWHYRVKSCVIFNKGQFSHICQLNVSCGQDSVSGISIYRKRISRFSLYLPHFYVVKIEFLPEILT
jgi:hypothetical protein